MVVRRNGWLYVYLSNESNQNVFFDNLVINHTRGPVVEKKEFYPFGMEIPGLSTKALKPNYAENRYKYNGKELQNKEFSDGSGLEDYDYGARMYDPQIGRWMVVDPMAEKSRRFSGYVYGSDEPISRIDPDGMTDFTLNQKTGDVKQIGDKNDKPDRILQTDKNGNIKKKGGGIFRVLGWQSPSW